MTLSVCREAGQNSVDFGLVEDEGGEDRISIIIISTAANPMTGKTRTVLFDSPMQSARGFAVLDLRAKMCHWHISLTLSAFKL
tara:strand:- start:44046 stop:44294 length:249 start_codon:yes stop_codon:yes gene_type:complete